MSAYRQFVLAALAKDEAAVIRLVRNHPDLHGSDGDEGSLLDVVRYHCPQFFPAVFAAGLSPDAGPAEPHQTLLQRAVCDDDLDLVKLCLRYGAHIERRNCEGETALGYAASWGSLEMVRLLVEAGADINAVERSADGFSTTALDATFSSDPAYDRPEIRSYLTERGAKRFRDLTTPSA